MLRRSSVPLKTPDEIDAMAEAGRLSAKALRKVGEAVKPGAVSYTHLDVYKRQGVFSLLFLNLCF